MVYVSVNAYNDADLLANCLDSVMHVLDRPEVAVVDGRYAEWPGAEDNSTDDTAAVADAYGASYWPDGPFDTEADKHRQRLARAPDDERVLFIDADERLLTFGDTIPDAHAGRVRIFNALMYGPRVSYYPRYFYPGQMDSIPRVDRFTLDCPVDRTDAITIVHRADLRSEAYREAKTRRFDGEGRDNWYRDYLETLADRGHDATFHECPACGESSLTRSRICGFGRTPVFSRVECCTRADGCHRDIVTVDFPGFKYLPDRVREGFAEDIERVRVELMAAGWDLAKVVPDSAFDRYEGNAVRWVAETHAPPTRDMAHDAPPVE